MSRPAFGPGSPFSTSEPRQTTPRSQLGRPGLPPPAPGLRSPIGEERSTREENSVSFSTSFKSSPSFSNSRQSSPQSATDRPSPWGKWGKHVDQWLEKIVIELKRCWGRIVLPCYEAGTEVEKLRLKFALTAAPTTGKRRGSFTIAATDAKKVFDEEVGDDEVLGAEEVLKLNGMDGIDAQRVRRLVAMFDDNFEEQGGIDLVNFKDMHYNLNKTCQAFLREGDSEAAKGELLMLYTMLDMQQEKVGASSDRGSGGART